MAWIDAAPSILVSYVILRLLCFVVYRLWFHPLSKYPGPYLAKFTNLYAAYHGWHGDLHLDMQRCHERHGRSFIVRKMKYRLDERITGIFVRYGPNKLLVNSIHGLQGKLLL